MHISISGFPALLIQAGFIVVFSAPIWIGAKVVGAEEPTFLRAAAALVVGLILAFISLFAPHGLPLILVPLGFLISFKYILKTSFFGAVILAVIAAAGYTLLSHLISSGVSFSNGGKNA